MTLLVLGLALWSLAHLTKRAAPGLRGDIAERLGPGPSKGAFALVIAIGLVLMIFGYRMAPVIPIYTPPSWTIHLNNLLMLVAVFLFGAAQSKSRVKGWLRNPMLTSVVIWACAHLLVNGDLASLILFGGVGLWALVNIRLIDTAGPWIKPTPGPVTADIRLIVITILVFAVITGIHAWLGYWPFPR